jgi:hypothetical protein
MLISENYIKMNEKLHADTEKRYGYRGHIWYDFIHISLRDGNFSSFIDYGCGKGSLGEKVQTEFPDMIIRNYDPAVEKFSKKPIPSDFLCSTDMLEHIEPEYLDNVLGDMKNLMLFSGFLIVSLSPARKLLSDGRNAHLIIENEKWWLDKISSYFKIDEFENFREVSLRLKISKISY